MLENVNQSLKYNSKIFFVHKHIYIRKVMYCADVVVIIEATVPIFVVKIKKMEADK